MRYLHNPNSSLSQNNDGFKYSSESAMIQHVKNIMKQNFAKVLVSVDVESSDKEVAEEANNNLDTQLQQSLTKIVSTQRLVVLIHFQRY